MKPSKAGLQREPKSFSSIRKRSGPLNPPLDLAYGGPASFPLTNRFGRLASQNDWESAQTEILVAKEPYAEAQGRHGCILMKEVSDDR